MGSGRGGRPGLAIATIVAALLSAACFGGGGGSQSAAQATPGATAAATSGPGTAASPSPVRSPAALPSPGASPSPARPTGPEQTHTVAAGETLGTIAQKYYDDPTQWRKIYDANKAAIGDNPDAIKVGTQLRIPPKE